MKRLSIIIVSWNTRQLLEKCLASIYATTSQSGGTEVLVVDNASTDGSADMVRELFPRVRLFPKDVNVGFAAANNLALQASRGQYVLLLNPDTIICASALQTLSAYLEENEEVGAAGPRLLNPDGTLQPSCFRMPTVLGELMHLLHLDRDERNKMETWDAASPRNVEVLLGACLMARRSVLDEVGFLDEGYFMYSEEVDLCRRIRQAGWTVVWVPQAEVVHYGGQSTRQVAADMFLHLYRAKLRYFRKFDGRLTARLFKLALLVGGAMRLVLVPFVWLEQPARRQQHLTLARHYWRLLRLLPSL